MPFVFDVLDNAQIHLEIWDISLNGVLLTQVNMVMRKEDVEYLSSLTNPINRSNQRRVNHVLPKMPSHPRSYKSHEEKDLFKPRLCDVQCLECGEIVYYQPYDFGSTINPVPNKKPHKD